jgi:hypothetical protein
LTFFISMLLALRSATVLLFICIANLLIKK